MKQEHLFQQQVIQYLHMFNIFVFETDVMDGLKFLNTEKQRLAFIQHHKNMGYVKGQPDLVAVLNNKVVFIELKTDKGRQSKEQKEVEQEIKKRGVDYIVVRSLEDLQNYLKK